MIRSHWGSSRLAPLLTLSVCSLVSFVFLLLQTMSLSMQAAQHYAELPSKGWVDAIVNLYNERGIEVTRLTFSFFVNEDSWI